MPRLHCEDGMSLGVSMAKFAAPMAASRRYGYLALITATTVAWALLTAATAAADIPADLLGKWSSSPTSCIDDQSEDVTVLTVTPDELSYYEISCDIVRAQPTELGAHVVADCVKGGGWRFGASISLRRLAGSQLEMHHSPRGPPSAGWVQRFYRCATTSTSEPKITYWDHNGSIMSLQVDGRTRRFYYDQPRPGMAAAGVQPNTLLFVGEVVGSTYVGTAHIFNARCGAFPYRVSGPIEDGGRRVVLTGRAPRVDRNCRIFGYLEDTLEFDLIEK